MQLRYIVLIILIFAFPWIYNAFKFADCDFESDFKCEIIHGIGVFMPPTAYITVWFKDDDT